MTPPDAPPPHPSVHLEAHLERVRLLLRRYLLLHPPAAEATTARDAARVERADAELAALDAELAAADQGLPIERLRARFDLSPLALRLLVAAAAPGLDVDVARAFARTVDDDTRQPTVAYLAELLARTPSERAAVLDQLAPSAPLVRWRLVRLGAPRAFTPEAPLLLRPVAVPERVTAWLRGRTAFDPERFDRIAHLRPAPGPRPGGDDDTTHAAAGTTAPTPAIDTSLAAALARALFRERDGRRMPLLLVGPALAGKAVAITATAAARGLATLDVDLEAVTLVERPADLCRDLAREARLQDAVLLLRRGDLLTEARAEVRRAVLDLLGEGALWMALTTRAEPGELAQRLPGAHVFRIDLPTDEEQARLWAVALPPDLPRAPDVDLARVVRRYHLTPGDILEAGAAAASRALLRGADSAVTLDDVVGAVRGRLRHRLGDVADLVTTPLSWDDLVLRDESHERVRELLASVKHRATVMKEWGFEHKLAYGRGLSALFSGPPGTGKTMVATLIAKELGLELFRVDLSRVVSKWVGETEKNLGRAFDEAQRSQAVLLFDEADALFAKRTDVKSSNDRYANLEVNYLLQRLESFEGIVLLTTNNASSIDDAFRRRLRFRIDFPTPDPDERERLWRAMLPPGAPLDDDVDFTYLGRKYEMTGGYIKNAVVRAAYLAADAPERRISHDILLAAASREWEDMGKLAVT